MAWGDGRRTHEPHLCLADPSSVVNRGHLSPPFDFRCGLSLIPIPGLLLPPTSQSRRFLGVWSRM
jgi:hypothetical protein